MRRSRFTITGTRRYSTTSERSVILAYGPNDARSYYEARGWTVEKVERGDYRTREGTTTAARPWSFNREAIAAAFEALTGEPIPANLRLINDRRGARTRGWFQGAAAYGPPTIKVRGNLTPEQANRTLWHELAHLAQYVRLGSPQAWLKAWDAERAARHGYRNRPWEVEAREWETLADTDWLLNGERR